MKRTLTLILFITLVISMSACAKSQQEEKQTSGKPAKETSESKETILPMKYVVPGNVPVDYDMVIDEVNGKLISDGVNIKAEIEYIPWDVWDQKVNLKLSTGEPFDLFQIMQGRVNFSKYAANGALIDISEYIDKYGENIKREIPEQVLNSAKLNNKLYTIPAYWYETASAENNFSIRKDIREKYGFDIPSTPAELLDQLELVIGEWGGEYKPYIPVQGKSISSIGPMRSHTLHRAYDTYPFIEKDQLVIFYEDNMMGSWIESEEFKADAEFFREAYLRGVISPDVLTLDNAQKNAQIANGDWYVIFGTSIKAGDNGIDLDDVEVAYFNEEKPYMRPVSIKNSNAIPITSQNPEAAIKFINWLYGSQENYDLFMYGIEGTHYIDEGQNNKKTLLDKETNLSQYSFADWMIGNLTYLRYDNKQMPRSITDTLYKTREDAVTHIADGFFFDGTNVKTELANVKTEIATSIVPIYCGVLDYSEYFEEALNNVKKAGLEEVIAEYERQYNEYLNSKN